MSTPNAPIMVSVPYQKKTVSAKGGGPVRRCARFFVFLLICAIFLGASGYSDHPATIKKKLRDDTLYYDVSVPFGSFDPTDCDLSGSGRIFPLLYSLLLTRDSAGEFVPDLAVSWDYDRENFIWTIRLRNDAFFHNGLPVTAMDVKFSLEAYVRKKKLGHASQVKKIRVSSVDTVRVELASDVPEFLRHNWSFEIVPMKKMGRKTGVEIPIGSGPYKFSYRAGDRRVVLVANDDYYGGRPHIDRVEFIYEPSKTKTWTRLLRGETDIGHDIAPGNYEMMQQYQDRFYFEEYISHRYDILLYNTKDPLFSDKRVRTALALAIDHQYLIDKILKGFAVPATGPMGVGSPYASPKLKPMPYDPEKALNLLFDAGWKWNREKRYLERNGEPFQFTVLFKKDDPVSKKVARCIQLCFNDVGVKAELEVLPVMDCQRRIRSNCRYQAVFLDINGCYYSNNTMLLCWMGNNREGAIIGGGNHPDVNRLIRQIVNENDGKKQTRLHFLFDELLVSPTARIISLSPKKNRCDVKADILPLSVHLGL